MKKIVILFFVLLLNSFSSINGQWIVVGENTGLAGDINALLEYNNVLYAGGTAYLFRSGDNELSWEGYLGPLAYAWSLTKLNGNIYCGLLNSYITRGLYKSTDNGQTWNLTAFTNEGINSLAAGNSFAVASTGLGSPTPRIYLTTDDGQSWSPISNGFTALKLAVSGNRIYSAGSGLKVTTDFGINWNTINNDFGIGIAVKDSLIFFGTQDGKIYHSTDYGQSWQLPFNITGAYIRSLHIYEQNIFAGTDSGFYVSTDGGLSFFNMNDNLGLSRIEDIMVYNNFVYVANCNYMDVPVAVWKRPLSDVLDVEEKTTQLLNNFTLSQNYPNPFNPLTKIKFSIPSVGTRLALSVQLKVYDVLGKEVAILVNEEKPAGNYEVEFNAAHLPSGVYFYQIKAGEYLETKKMMVVK